MITTTKRPHPSVEAYRKLDEDAAVRNEARLQDLADQKLQRRSERRTNAVRVFIGGALLAGAGTVIGLRINAEDNASRQPIVPVNLQINQLNTQNSNIDSQYSTPSNQNLLNPDAQPTLPDSSTGK